MTGEYADVAQPSGPMRRLGMRWSLSPGKGQLRRDVWRVVGLQKGGEIDQSPFCLSQLEPQPSPHLDVLLNSLSECAHWASPGHGKASVRNASRSTLTRCEHWL